MTGSSYYVETDRPERVNRLARIERLPLRKIRGRAIAEFASARDARLFAGLKRTEGYDVTVMQSTNPQFLWVVRLLEPAL